MKHAKLVKTNEIQNPNLITHDLPKTTRLNKFISDSGFCSRRKADKYIEDGLVYINNKKAILGQRVLPTDIVTINNKVIPHENKLVYLALNKPRGITSTTDLKDKTNIVDFVNFNKTIFPIGRLDKDSHGLILLTNDGDIVNKTLREEYGHEKEYIVKVDKKINNKFINDMKKGVKIYNLVSKKYEVTKKCDVFKINDYTFKIILKQGLNRQIRRMTNALGYKVVDLQRVRVLNILLNNLKPGQYRYLTNDELYELNNLINK